MITNMQSMFCFFFLQFPYFSVQNKLNLVIYKGSCDHLVISRFPLEQKSLEVQNSMPEARFLPLRWKLKQYLEVQRCVSYTTDTKRL